jgi:hypothetical protein
MGILGLFRITKRWETRWRQHTIVVENWWTPFLLCGETLKIDDRVVDAKSGWGKISERLQGYIREGYSRYPVRVRLGGIDSGFRAGCHILVDGELVGGDLNKELLA